MFKQTDTIKTVGSDGRSHTVVVFTDYIDGEIPIGPHAIEELKQLRTSDGKAVHQVGKGEYKIVQTGVYLRSYSLDAP